MLPPITIIIKTFERPKAVIRLLTSIRKKGLKYPVIIADDSKISGEAAVKKLFPDLNITYINLPFDSGLSAGRNTLVNAVKTEYFVLCDDDFVFEERTDIKRGLECLKQNDFDILGGDFYNYITISGIRTILRLIIKKPDDLKRYLLNRPTTSRYIGNFISGNKKCELHLSNLAPAKTPFRCDLVNNFFIAKTESVKRIGGWDKDLKLGEHEDFFLRARINNLKVAYLGNFGTAHYPVIKANYKKYRLRCEEYKNLFVRKHGFTDYVEKQIDLDKVLFEYHQ